MQFYSHDFGPPIQYSDTNPTTGKFYKIHSQRANYTEAKEICESEGAHLLMVKTDADASFILSYYNGSSTCKQQYS